jgi:hypothetical protein
MKWSSGLFKKDKPIKELSSFIFNSSLACVELLKNDIAERYSDDSEYQSRYLLVILETTCFLLHFVNRRAWEILGEEKRSKLQDSLYPLVIEPTINTLCRNTLDDVKIKAINELIENVNNAEIEYSECKKLFTIPGEIEGDSSLDKLLSGKPRFGLVNQFIDNISKVIYGGEVCMDAAFHLKIFKFMMDILKEQVIEKLLNSYL